MENTHIYEPLKEFKNIYKERHKKNVDELFESLVSQSKVDIKENADTIKAINKFTEAKKNVTQKINNYSFLRGFLIIITIIFLFYSIYTLTNLNESENFWLELSLSILGILLSILFIYLTVKKINPFIKELKKNKDDLTKKIDEKTKLSIEQMRPLNELFNEEMPVSLFKKTIPLINLDNIFDYKRFDYLVNKFGLSDAVDLNRSTLFVKSGDINGNPFYIANDLVHHLGTKTYTGSITISWTTYTTINNKRVAQTRTQVLTASVNKPFPYYHEESYLVYGNEVAPLLSFSRTDSDAEHMSQKQIDKFVDRKIKKLEKKSAKSIKKGGDYTVLGHSEFEVLFGATNRDHEVQFRLLFTPLAQKQLLELMKDKVIGYGDNFDFIKRKMINIIYPDHLNMIKLDGDPKNYYSNDFKEIEKNFKTYNNEYFKAIYFAFAPVLAIPLYQQHKPHEYIYKDLYPSNASFYEHESVANKLDINKLKNVLSSTNNILKTEVIKSADNLDEVKVTAYGYQSIPRVDYQTKMGGDGKLHTIPIHWDEYIPVFKDSTINIEVPKEETKETHTERIRNYFERLHKDKNVNQKDIRRVGKFLAVIINK
ncbi:MAG: hypothetical protein WC907_03610 [Acholeplasmataceae bacterium]